MKSHCKVWRAVLWACDHLSAKRKRESLRHRAFLSTQLVIFLSSPYSFTMLRLIRSYVSFLCLAMIVMATPTTNNDEQRILSTAPSSSLSDKWAWFDCGTADDAVQVTSIKISPDPPQPGQNLTVYATGIVYDEIASGSTVNVQVKIGSIKLLTKELDICDEAEKADADIQCPVSEGEYTVAQSVPLPDQIPPAKFNIHVEGQTATEQSLLCLDLTVDFRKSFTKLFG